METEGRVLGAFVDVLAAQLGAGRGEGGRRWRGGVLLVDRQPHVLSDFALSLPSPVVAPLEVLQAGRVNGPIVAFPVGRPPGLDEAVIEAKIVPAAAVGEAAVADGAKPQRLHFIPISIRLAATVRS